MARFLRIAAAALAPLAGAQVNLVSLGSGTACRSTADVSAQCIENATTSCRDKYDLLDEMTLADCKMVCETLAASCTGIEWQAPGSGSHGRCEIWKVPIVATVSVSGFTCYQDQDNTTGTDGSLYVYWEFAQPTANASIVSQMDATAEALLMTSMKGGIVAAFGATSGVSRVAGLTVNNVDVKLDTMSVTSFVVLTPPTGASPLVMYAVMRPANLDTHDGTAPIAAAMCTGLTNQLTPLNSQMPFLNAGETVATVQIVSKSRRLLAINPYTPAPNTPVNGAGGSRLAALSLLAPLTAGTIALF